MESIKTEETQIVEDAEVIAGVLKLTIACPKCRATDQITVDHRIVEKTAQCFSCGATVNVPMFSAIYAADRVKTAEDALREIAKGEGRFSRDPLTHASNTIEDMKALARAALPAGDQ